MVIQTTRDRLAFPGGRIGLQDLTEWLMFDGPEGTPFKWLQSTARPELAYIICDPSLFIPAYRVEVTVEDLSPIGVTAVEDAVVAVILSVPDDWRLMTANLAGPLVFSVERRLGMQVVLPEAEWSVKHRVFAGVGEGAG